MEQNKKPLEQYEYGEIALKGYGAIKTCIS